MNRSNWRFQYRVAFVYDAVIKKKAHHLARLEFWKGAQTKVLSDCKEQGLVVHESLAGSNYMNKSPGYGPRIEIPESLQLKLNESTLKITEHTNKEAQYDAWAQVLISQPKTNTLDLDQEDYLFFFGTI